MNYSCGSVFKHRYIAAAGDGAVGIFGDAQTPRPCPKGKPRAGVHSYFQAATDQTGVGRFGFCISQGTRDTPRLPSESKRNGGALHLII